jgi:hypothetical protein
VIIIPIIIIIIIIRIPANKREGKNIVIYVYAFIYYTYHVLSEECDLVESGAVYWKSLLSSLSQHLSCFLQMEAADSSKALVG